MEKNTGGILLESGTNELEVLEFVVAGNNFGINVAKVRDLMEYRAVQPMPRAHDHVEGIFNTRGEIITVVSLASYLNLEIKEDVTRDILIVAGFNQMSIAFHVNGVESIHRISWSNIEKPDNVIYGGSEGVITGLAHIDDRIISIVDFEKIVADISPQSSIKISEIEEMGERARSEKPILIAEDSMLLSKMILDSLHKAGYVNVTVTNNGQEAWIKLQELSTLPGPLEERVSCIITDIEMPQMDGHYLTKLIKTHDEFRKIPVIIFSSLIDENMRIKGQELGADAQLSKPEIGHLVEVIDKLCL